MRTFILAVFARPVLFIMWALALWGGVLWCLLAVRVTQRGPGLAMESFVGLLRLSKLSMLLFPTGLLVLARVLAVERRRRDTRTAKSSMALQ